MKRTKLIILSLLLSLGCFTAFSQRTVSLEEALNIAFANSPDIQRSRLNIERNKELLNAQLASLKSKFALDVTPFSYSKQDQYDDQFSTWYNSETKKFSSQFSIVQPIKAFDGTLSLINSFEYHDNVSTTGSDFGYYNNLYIQYRQPLFMYNQTKMNLERNRLNLENATLAYSMEMLNMEKYVTQAFYDIYQKQMSLQIAIEDFENQKISKEIIESKVEGELSAREELFQAELNYSTSESNLENQKVALENSKDDFKRLLGISLNEEIEVAADVQYKRVSVNLQKAVENGLKQRLELQQKEISITNAQFDLIQTSANNKFKGDISLSMGFTGTSEVFKDIYDTPSKSPQASITFSIPLFDWGERKARIKAAELSVESTRIDLKDQESDIIINIRKVYRNLNNLIRQIGIADQDERNAQSTYEINFERYKSGDLTSIDLERFQNQLSEKKMNKINALIRYKLELLNLKIQSLWDFENNMSFIPQELQQNITIER